MGFRDSNQDLIGFVHQVPERARERIIDIASTQFEDEACTAHNSDVAAALSGLPSSIQTILLIGRWAYYAEGHGIGRDAENLITLAPSDSAAFTGDDAPALLEGAFRQTLDGIKTAGLEPYILRQPPEIFLFSARETARTLAYGQADIAELAATTARTSRIDLELRNASVDPILSRLGVPVIDSWLPLCAEIECRAFHDGQVFYFDNNHVTNAGAIAIRDIFGPVFSEARNR